MTDADDIFRSPGGDRTVVPLGRVVMCCVATLSAATAVIHLAVAGAHFQEYWLFGAFMLVVAWLQLLWAAAAIARPSAALLWGGAMLNAAVVAVYVVTRTAGDLIGPAPHAVEPLGVGDGLCTALEVVVVAASAWLLIARTDRQVRRGLLIGTPAATGAVIAILLSVALVAGGPEMVMSTASAGTRPVMRMPGTRTSPIRLATTSPAGAITMPAPGMQMAPGMRMASSAACAAQPTAAQQKAAVSLVDATWQGAGRFRSLAAAKAAGYRPITPTGAPVVHYLNRSYYLATLLGGRVLDTAQPQSLVYANTAKGAVLVAAMYITAPGGATPRPGGCLTQWHVHTNLCTSRGLGVVGVVSPAHPACPAGSRNRVTPPMMHVWFVPIPGGPTAIDASDAQIVHAAQRVAAPANGTA
jgi:hypothetical protein